MDYMILLRGFQGHHQLASDNGITHCHFDVIHFALHTGNDTGFHLHGFDDNQNIVLLDLVALLHLNLADCAGDGRTNLALIVRFCLSTV